MRLSVDLSRRVPGADVCHYGGILREGPILQGLQSPLLHDGSAGGKDGSSQVSACSAGVASTLLRGHCGQPDSCAPHRGVILAMADAP